jgi:hypothetical protein
LSALLLEVRAAGNSWHRAGRLSPGDREGRVSCNRPGGAREVILFACLGDRSRVRRSAGGPHFERGAARVVSASGLEDLAILADGESYVMDVVTDAGHALAVRWTHVTQF